jgi:AcrR family transcriptional regulator
MSNTRSTGARAARGPYAKTAARREGIIDAARASFVERGYDDTSLRDIATRAGITHAGLLHHFRDKAELLVQVLRRRDTAAQQYADELVAAGCSGAENAVRVVQEELRDPDLVRLWATLAPAASRPSHPAHEYFTQRYARYRDLIAHEIRDEGEAAGLRNGVDADTAASLLLAALDGLQLQALLEPALDVEAYIRSLFDLLFPDRTANRERLS